MTSTHTLLGLGIYTPAEGARLLRVPAQSLRRWARGYTYWDAEHRSRHKSGPITTPDLPVIRGHKALSFLELMELRVVGMLRNKGISLQHIRNAAAIARQVLQTRHPFASRRIFTDRKRILAYVDAGHVQFAMVELDRKTVHQLIAGPVLEPLLESLDFDAESGIAKRWWPMGKGHSVVLDPEVSFGAPIIAGTRIRTELVAGMAAVDSPVAVAAAFEVDAAQIRSAVEFERLLQAA
jgi:uncharacterized protein (DUF433 family)